MFNYDTLGLGCVKRGFSLDIFFYENELQTWKLKMLNYIAITVLAIKAKCQFSERLDIFPYELEVYKLVQLKMFKYGLCLSNWKCLNMDIWRSLATTDRSAPEPNNEQISWPYKRAINTQWTCLLMHGWGNGLENLSHDCIGKIASKSIQFYIESRHNGPPIKAPPP